VGLAADVVQMVRLEVREPVRVRLVLVAQGVVLAVILWVTHLLLGPQLEHDKAMYLKGIAHEHSLYENKLI